MKTRHDCPLWHSKARVTAIIVFPLLAFMPLACATSDSLREVDILFNQGRWRDALNASYRLDERKQAPADVVSLSLMKGRSLLELAIRADSLEKSRQLFTRALATVHAESQVGRLFDASSRSKARCAILLLSADIHAQQATTEMKWGAGVGSVSALRNQALAFYATITCSATQDPHFLALNRVDVDKAYREGIGLLLALRRPEPARSLLDEYIKYFTVESNGVSLGDKALRGEETK